MCHDDLYHHLISWVMVLDLIPWTLLAGAELAMPRGKLCLSQFLEVPVQTPQFGCQDSPTSSPADSNPSLGPITYQFVRITPIPISFLLHHCPESKSDREQISCFENRKTHRGEICLGIKVNGGLQDHVCPFFIQIYSSPPPFFSLSCSLVCTVFPAHLHLEVSSVHSGPNVSLSPSLPQLWWCPSTSSSLNCLAHH